MMGVLLAHRWSQLVVLLGVLGCVTSTTSAPGTSDCLDSLDPIRTAEAILLDDGELRTYVLCPDTVFPVAKSFNQDGTPKYGQYPLIIGRSNIHILCGVDGRSENNCVLTGGLLHVGFFDEWETGRAVTNALVQGLTFHDAKNTNVLAENKGGLTLRDCLFKDNHNISPVYANDPSTNDPGRRRQLTHEAVPDRLWERKVSKAKPSELSMQVSILNCVFQNNVIWSYSGASMDGLISLSSAAMVIADTTFASTTMESAEMNLAYLIYNNGGSLTMHTNCFLGNDARIAPVVIDNGDMHATSSFVQHQTNLKSSTACDFAARVTNGNLSRIGVDAVSFACEDSDASRCAAASLRKVDVPCIDTLNDVYHGEFNVTDVTTTRTYVLCPETTFSVGTVNSKSTEPSNGSHPIVISRPNVRVLCGANGKSENQCVLSGGDVQLRIVDEFDTGGPPATNSLVSGLTFTNASSFNVYATVPSHVVLQDCIFKNNENLASISLQGPYATGFRRLSEANEARGLDALKEGPSMDVVGCTFDGNVIGTISDQSSGVIVSRNATLRVKQSTFTGTVDRSKTQFMAYVIASIQGVLELTGNCFASNEVTLAQVISDGGSIEANMNAGNEDGVRTVGCSFVATFDTSSNVEETKTARVISGISNRRTEVALDISCIEFDVDGPCYLDDTKGMSSPQWEPEWSASLPFDPPVPFVPPVTEERTSPSSALQLSHEFTCILSVALSLFF